MKKLFYSLIATGTLLTTGVNSASAIDFGADKAQPLGGTAETIDNALITLITTITQFVTILAVLYAIFGGFTILTAAGDEEKVKKGRSIIFHAILGIIVIWLAYSIISWVVLALQGSLG